MKKVNRRFLLKVKLEACIQNDLGQIGPLPVLPDGILGCHQGVVRIIHLYAYSLMQVVSKLANSFLGTLFGEKYTCTWYIQVNDSNCQMHY